MKSINYLIDEAIEEIREKGDSVSDFDVSKQLKNLEIDSISKDSVGYQKPTQYIIDLSSEGT